MPEQRKIRRTPAAAPTPAQPQAGQPAAQERQAQQPQKPRRPAAKPPKKRKPLSKRQRYNRTVLGSCLLCLVAVIIFAVVLVRCTAEEETPATADFGTPAAAWQKNELGYYFNSSGEVIPGAVLKGIDVSKFQGEVDWETAKNAGIDFAIIRCGFGGEWDGAEEGWAQDDPQWRRNADECTRLGIPFGTYLYSYATTEEEACSEADHVARLLGLRAPEQEGLDDYTANPYKLSYPVYYDLEDKSISGVLPSEMYAIIRAFFGRLSEYGYTGEEGIYASLNWVRARFNDSIFDNWDGSNLWIARFGDSLDYTGKYNMWQCTYSAPGADYGVQSDTVDIDFVMRPFTIEDANNRTGKAYTPVYVNDTRTMELQLDAKGARATLTTNEPTEADHGRRVFWTSSDESVATVDKSGVVRARADSGECTITGTLADGTETVSCRVRVGTITVPVYVTAELAGDRTLLADAAALKASTPDSILLDAGNSLHGSASASLTGGMDMMSGFSAAGYDMQAIALNDLAYGTTRLVSDANMASGSSLASNLLDTEGVPILYRSTSWNRNRVTDGQYTFVARAGHRIGFFVVNDPAQAGTTASAFGEFVTAKDWKTSAKEQIKALKEQDCDTIIAIAATAPADSDWQKVLLNSGATAVIDATATESDNASVLAAGLGLNGIAQLNLVYEPGAETAAVEVQPTVNADMLQNDRAVWENLRTTSDTDTAQSDAADAADPEKDTAAAEGVDTAAPTENADETKQAGADAYAYASDRIAELDADDQSIFYTPLFTYAENPDADRTISFGNYVAALYAEIVANDTASGLPEGAEAEAFAGGVTELAYGDITRGDLLNALPATARIQLVSMSADAAKALAESGAVSRVYANSLTEYAPEGDTAYVVTDSITLAALGTEYTLLRDYGDVFWAVRMNINDLTNNFNDPLTMPEAPQRGVGRKG